MRGRIAGLLLFIGGAGASGAAEAMSSAAQTPARRCEVMNAARLPAASGGSKALCREIERAVTAAAPTSSYTAKIVVLTASRLSAALVVNDHALPEQNFAVMDRELDSSSVRRFAEALAAEVAKATKE